MLRLNVAVSLCLLAAAFPCRGRAQVLGVSVHSLDPALAADYAAASLRVVRTDLWWHVVEPEPGRYVWDAFDPFVRALEAHGITPLLILCYGHPHYDAGAPPTSPAGRAAFARYAAAAAARYPGAILEVWNEPNTARFWPPAPDPAAYTALVSDVAEAVAAVRTRGGGRVQLVGPALGGASCDHAFLDATFRLGLLDLVDAVSVHPYCAPNAEATAAFYARVRRSMRGRGERPVIVSEWGVPSAPAPWSEEDQAETFRVILGATAAAGVDLVVLYEWRDGGPAESPDPEHHFGLRRLDGMPKPAYDVVRLR